MRQVFSTSVTALLATVIGTITSVDTASAERRVQGIQLAQQGEISYFIDSNGRRVYYDVRTDRILAIEDENGRRRPARGNERYRNSPALNDPNYFPPPPQPVAQPNRPNATAIPAPQTVERAPLGGADTNDGQRFRRLDDVMPQDTTASIPTPGLEPEQPQEPAVQSYPGTQTAAIPPVANPVPNDGDLTAKLQVLLDRKGMSPGVIDGRIGSNVKKALVSYTARYREELPTTDEAAIDAMLEQTGGPAFIQYTLTQEDVSGPYVAAIPVDYAEKAKLESMAYTSPVEMLGERFHMDEDYLKKINPGANFYAAGTTIRVANPGPKLTGKVAHIDADKGAEQVRAYDAEGRLVAAYPATIGSTDTPSPSGLVNIERIAVNPNYTYNPKINFTQGENREILTIPPGPNGPVGSVWIALSKPTYGIHGTPEPARIGKTNSHGCIRLTNWDAEELVKMVKKGVTVEFLD